MSNKIEVPECSGSVVALTKIGQKEHLEKLQEGILRFRDLSFYSKKEHRQYGWHDSKEQIRGIYQAEKVKISIKTENEEVLLDASTGLTNQVYFGYSKTNERVLCFHSLANGIWAGNEISEMDDDSYSAHFKIPSHFKNKFEGDYIWLIYNPTEFFLRLKTAVEAIPEMPHKVTYGPVHYIDFKKAHGDISEHDVGFIKDIQFSEEKEFRLKANSNQRLPDPFQLQVGDLSDISLIIALDDFNQNFRAKFVEIEELDES